MTGFGPKAGSEHDTTPEPATVDRDAAASLFQQAFTDGQESVTRDPQAGYDLGFDVGLGARNDHGRVWARQLMQGHTDGLAARYEMTAEMKEAERAQAVSKAPEHQPELEAG